jgi:hypothetical protein
MPIDPSIEQGAFEPEATAAMGEAFDAACKELHEVGEFQMVRKVVAQRIIAAARRGELDPVRLRAAALSGLSIIQYRPQLSICDLRDTAVRTHTVHAQICSSRNWLVRP